MKTKFTLITAFLLFILSMNSSAQSYDNLWKSIGSAQQKDMPATVVKLCDQIIKKAKKENQSGQLMKAYFTKLENKTSISADSIYTGIKDIEQWCKTTNSATDKMVLHSTLSSFYAGYANQSRYRLATDVKADLSDKDIREWSKPQFYDAIMTHLKASIEDINTLHATKSDSYMPLAEQEWASKYYGHDLLHIIFNRAIDALSSSYWVFDRGRQAAIDKYKAALYDQLIEYYRNAGNESAMILLSLQKIENISGKSANDAKVIDALHKLLQQTDTKNEVRTEIYLKLAELYTEKKENVKAVELCNKALSLYPNYIRINTIKEQLNKILRTEISIRNFSDEVYPKDKIQIKVTHRNADGFDLLYYRVPDQADQNKIKLGNCSLIKTQHFALKRTADYLPKTDSVIIETPDYGTYAAVVRADGVKTSDEQFSVFCVSKLKVLMMKVSEKNSEVVVVDRKSGQLIENATVLISGENNKILFEQNTNAQGKVTFSIPTSSYPKVKAIKGTDKYMKAYRFYSWFNNYSDGRTSQKNMILMTDRGIYRPGQTIYAKGIVYTQQGDSTRVDEAQTYNVSLRDANSQEIATKKVTTNKFGSFNLQFVLPSSCLNGTFYIETPLARKDIRVEEYKRPTFEITTDKVNTSYSLGDTIHLKGNAKMFSGIPVGSAIAKYTVRREKWSWWWNRDTEIICTDSVKTDAEGRFDLPIYLASKPDSEDNLSTYYTFNVNIDVTNQAGETQSGSTSIGAGTRSLILRLTSDPMICKDKAIKVQFEASNLLHEQVKANISYTLSAIKDGKTMSIVDKGSSMANSAVNKEAWRKLASGKYELCLTAKDFQGRDVEQKVNIVLFSAADKHPADDSPLWLYIPNQNDKGMTYINAKHPAKLYFGTSLKETTVLMNVFAGRKQIESKVLRLSDETKAFEYPYRDSYKDGISINFCFIKDNKLYQKTATFTKSLPERELKMKWSVFRDKLRPGQKEEWKLDIATPYGKPADAEMLAYMYDASLDKLVRHDIGGNIYFPRSVIGSNWLEHHSELYDVQQWSTLPMLDIKQLSYDKLYDISKAFNARQHILIRGIKASRAGESNVFAALEAPAVLNENVVADFAQQKTTKMTGSIDTSNEKDDSPSSVRQNFAETAFFYPELRTDAKGSVSIVFTLPESLTRWKFQGYAHTQNMMYGTLEGEATASKEFMLTPNLPRFVRTGDHTSMTATISNKTAKPINANVKFELFDPTTDQIILTQSKPVALGANKSEAASFDFSVTDRYDILGVRMVADGGTFSDGEQHIIPVLSDKVTLTETLPMPIRGNQSREFSLESLFNGHSKTATKRSLTIEYTGNPAWYAVQALPSLSMPQSDNAISWATAFYANSLASHIANSTPRIKNIFDSWKNEGKTKESLLSNLQKNQELKNILLEESPWVLEAKSEQEQKARLSTLFDLNNIQSNNLTAINKLQQLQDEDGGWSWFKGMQSSAYTTEYILRLMARLPLLTGQTSDQIKSMQEKGLNFMYKESQRDYEYLKKAEQEGQKIKGISHSALRYLYLIAISEAKVPSKYQTAYNYFLSKVDEVPTSQDMQEKALAAVVLHKAGKAKAANEYIASLREHLTKSDELGEYFDFNDNPFVWGNMHLNAHTAAIEAFDKVANDSETVEEMKLWLLKQKQTQAWNSPVSTADAIYALLERGNELLANKGVVNIRFAKKEMNTTGKDASAGLGYIKKSYTDPTDVDARTINVEKKDAGIAWGAVYAQFSEDIANVKQQGSSSFNVTKNLFVKRIVNNVEELQPISADSKLQVGDIVTARLIIKLDRAMDFVQLKEQRGACFEPLTTLSGYHWGAGAGYYEEIKDASTNFFFDSLQKGVYTLEINYRVSRQGNYEAGLSTLQCAYAPEFAAHSASLKVTVGL